MLINKSTLAWPTKNFPEKLFGGSLDKENNQLSIDLEESDPFECVPLLELFLEKVREPEGKLPFILAVALDRHNVGRPYSGEAIHTYCTNKNALIKDPVTQRPLKEVHFFSLMDDREAQWIGKHSLNRRNRFHIFQKIVVETLLAATPLKKVPSEIAKISTSRLFVAKTLLEKKEYALAKEWVDITLRDFPKNSRALLLRASLAYIFSKNKKNATHEEPKIILSSLLENDPKNKEARLFYADILSKEKSFFESHVEYVKVTEQYPKSSRGFFGRGASLEQLLGKEIKKLDRTEISLAYSRAIQLNEANIKARFSLTRVDLERLHKDALGKATRKILLLRIEENIHILERSQYDITTLKAKLSYEKKDFSEAYKLFQEALRNDMHSIEIQLYLADLLGIQKVHGEEGKEVALKILSTVEHLDKNEETVQCVREMKEQFSSEASPEAISSKEGSSLFTLFKRKLFGIFSK